MTIVAGELQTMNFYMNHTTDYMEPIVRGLYNEIAMIEEQEDRHLNWARDMRERMSMLQTKSEASTRSR